jgi:L-ascorbate metabolism protein UlaG (beta-lactamase superfamily)
VKTLIFITGVLLMLLYNDFIPEVCSSDDVHPTRLELSPQYENGKFNGHMDVLNMSVADYISTGWDYLFGENNKTPPVDLPHEPVDLLHFKNPANGQLNVTWLGHSSLMINVDGYRILTDPVFEKSASVFGPTRFNGHVPLNIEQVPNIHAVIISHDHYDHLNKFSIRHLNEKTEKFIVPLAVGDLIAQWGVPRGKIVELDWWEEFHFDPRLMIAATPAQHFSGRGLCDRNKTLWASWVIKTPSHSLFFSGDSGYFDGFKRIGEKHGPFDMTFIECGAYDKSWPRVHMFPEQTVQAHLDLKGKILHPIHWGTFKLALHPWYEPMERLTVSAVEHNIETATPMVGETFSYGKSTSKGWWQKAMANKGV